MIEWSATHVSIRDSIRKFCDVLIAVEVQLLRDEFSPSEKVCLHRAEASVCASTPSFGERDGGEVREHIDAQRSHAELHDDVRDAWLPRPRSSAAGNLALARIGSTNRSRSFVALGRA
jgi:hypothetical protein